MLKLALALMVLVVFGAIIVQLGIMQAESIVALEALDLP